jgi:hypothetical protein
MRSDNGTHFDRFDHAVIILTAALVIAAAVRAIYG